MSKRIVIIPNFGESHLIKCQIPNIVDTLNPDIVIYNEGLFPTGPESRLVVTDKFRLEYCYKDTNLAWDTLETQKLIEEAKITYPNIKWIHNEMKFEEGMKASAAYTYAVSNFEELGIDVTTGDYIFPYEPDIFHLESDSNNITYILNRLKANQGFTSIWLDFLETQHYIEACNNPYEGRPNGRKLAICFGDIEYYKHVVSQFESMNYNMLLQSDLITYHYNWFRFDKNKQLRFEQIVRDDVNYWKEFEEGLMRIQHNSKINNHPVHTILRPRRTNITKFASYINIEHPNAIKVHNNYIK